MRVGSATTAQTPPLSVMITGAGRGLGAALVAAYAALPAQVIALVRTEEAQRRIEALHGAAVHVIRADVAKEEDEARIRSGLVALDRGLDLLINNAGFPGTSASLEQINITEIETLFQTHCLGALRVTRAALPFLQRSETPQVVNISSRISSLQLNAEGQFALRKYSYGYRIAKAAQNMLSLCLLEEFRGEGLGVLAIHPGQLTTVSASRAAALSPEEAAQMFIKFMESRHGSVRLPAVLQDTSGRSIPW